MLSDEKPGHSHCATPPGSHRRRAIKAIISISCRRHDTFDIPGKR